MNPRAYRRAARQAAMTKARIIVFFCSALLMSEMSWSAPGIDLVSIKPSILLVFLSLLVYSSILAAEWLPISIISLVIAIVLSNEAPSPAKFLILAEPFLAAFLSLEL